mgnify:CR=1 FL=1
MTSYPYPSPTFTMTIPRHPPPPFTISYPLSAILHPPSAICHHPSAICHMPSATYHPSLHHRRPHPLHPRLANLPPHLHPFPPVVWNPQPTDLPAIRMCSINGIPKRPNDRFQRRGALWQKKEPGRIRQ